MNLQPLPKHVTELLLQHNAPPRLTAHLTLVHDVALQLLTKLATRTPRLAVDRDAVAFGAATHDIGKALVVEELSAPGKTHELRGEALMVTAGVEARLARFARTHGLPPDAQRLTLEDLQEDPRAPRVAG